MRTLLALFFVALYRKHTENYRQQEPNKRTITIIPYIHIIIQITPQTNQLCLTIVPEAASLDNVLGTGHASNMYAGPLYKRLIDHCCNYYSGRLPAH